MTDTVDKGQKQLISYLMTNIQFLPNDRIPRTVVNRNRFRAVKNLRPPESWFTIVQIDFL